MSRLPALLVLTDRHQARSGLVPTVAAAVAGGAQAVVLREKDLAGEARRCVAVSLRACLDPVGGALVIAGADVSLAREVGASGVHLGADDPWPAAVGDLVVGRSCHGRDDLARAADEGAHYATLSPVFASPSKPGYGPALTSDGLAEMVASAALPVYALGGVDAGSAPACIAAGAAGVAVMGAVMASEDPAGAAEALVLSLAAGSCLR